MSSEQVTKQVRALRERAGISMPKLAKQLGYKNASSWQRYEDAAMFKKEYLPIDLTKKFADAVVGKGSPPISDREVYALAGIDPPQQAGIANTAPSPLGLPLVNSEIVYRDIPERDVRASGGGGSIVSDEAKLGEWRLPANYVDSITRQHTDLVIIEVVGDSMYPTLGPGDRVMVDLQDRDPTTPGIFVLFDGDATLVKRLEKVPGSVPVEIALISDNEHHGRYTALAHDLNIAGRVVWRAQRVS